MYKNRMMSPAAIMTAILATLILAVPDPSLAREGRGPHAGRPGGAWGKSPAAGIMSHRAALGLTDDQVQRLQGIDSRSRESLEKGRADVRARKRIFFESLDAGSIDRTESNRRIEEISREMAAMHRARLRSMMEARAILTPDQRSRLRDMRKRGRQDGNGGPNGPSTINQGG